MQELKELISSYQSQREGGRGAAICSSIISTARQCNMDKDCNLPPDEADTKEMALDDRDLVVGNVYRKCDLSSDTNVHQKLLVRPTPHCGRQPVNTAGLQVPFPGRHDRFCGMMGAAE